MKFELGQVVATPGAIELIEAQATDKEQQGALMVRLLRRHVSGDWGDLDAEDVASNNDAVESGYRILSSYRIGDGKIWIITEADRSATTLLLPEDY